MNTFKLTITSPDGELFSGEVFRIILRGAEGDLAIMAGHIPFVTAIKPGKCTVELDDGSTKSASCDGGILTVSSDTVRVLAGSFNWE